MTALHFRVTGIAQPKGSSRAFVPRGWKHASVTADNPKMKGWQDLVAAEASRTIAELPGGTFARLEGAVSLTVMFALPRPKYLKKRLAHHLVKPDLDKLVRTVKDALTGVAWVDDSQVVEVVAIKGYAYDSPFADVWVRPAKPLEVALTFEDVERPGIKPALH